MNIFGKKVGAHEEGERKFIVISLLRSIHTSGVIGYLQVLMVVSTNGFFIGGFPR
jgi:hypothetical protein